MESKTEGWEERLKKYANSKEHQYGGEHTCMGFNEGQICCLYFPEVLKWISLEISKAKEEGRQEGYTQGVVIGIKECEPEFEITRKEERNRILQIISEIKRWVATIQGEDEYVVRDKDLDAIKEKI